MISEREKYERFENYLKGMMDEASRNSFERELDNDEQLYHEFINYRQAHNLILESRLLDIRHELQLIHASHLKARRLWRNTGGIVILTGLILTAIFFYTRHNTGEENNESVASEAVISDSLQSAGNADHLTDLSELKNKNRPDIMQKTDTPELKILPSADRHVTDAVKPVEVIINTKEKSPALRLISDTFRTTKSVAGKSETNKQIGFNDCSQIEITCDFNVVNTCTGRSQGKIVFLNQTLKGGVPPYEFSIDNGASYFNHALFINLQEGTYRLLIRDGNHCTSYIGSAEVVGYECDFRFAPGLGEVWDIPFINENEGVLRILSKEGKLLYVSEVGQYTRKQWDGRTLNGDLLPLGVYLFTIELDNGIIYNGTITVIK